MRLFRSFMVEQTDPDRFYGELAADSLAGLSEVTDLVGRTVLDVGAGSEHFADAFRAAGALYIPVDCDPRAPALARVGVVGSAGALPIADASVDIVFSSNLLEHVPDIHVVADDLIRVLKPGGVLYLSYTNWLSPWGGHETSPWHWLGVTYATSRYIRRHGRRPKNRVGENLFKVSVADGLTWARTHPEIDVVVARPRYLPDAARHVLRVKGLREVVTWNLLLILRRRAERGRSSGAVLGSADR